MENAVRTPEKISWTNLENRAIEYGENNRAAGTVKLATKPGFAETPRDGAHLPWMPSRTIELSPAATLGRRDTGLRGTLVVKLPDMKRIQLELFHDVIARDADAHGEIRFTVRVETAAPEQGPEAWTAVQTFTEEAGYAAMNGLPIQTVEGVSYTPRARVVDLSSRRGKTVRISLEAVVPDWVVSPQRLRINEFRLVAASFDYALDEPVAVGNPEYPKPALPDLDVDMNDPGAVLEFPPVIEQPGPTILPEGGEVSPGMDIPFYEDGLEGMSMLYAGVDAPGPLEEVLLDVKPDGNNPPPVGNLVNYPDTGVAQILFSGNAKAYISGGRMVTSVTDEQGVFGVSLTNKNLHNADVSEIRNGLARDGQQWPEKFLEPMAGAAASFDHYLAIGSAFVDNGKVHAFLQAEDHRENANATPYLELDSPADTVYGRIAYARSDDGESFARMSTDGAAPVSHGLTPIITHFQPEEVACQIGLTSHPITGVTIAIQHPSGIKGSGPPSVIVQGNYVYMFYTRFMDTRTQTSNPYWQDYPRWGFPPYLSVNEMPLDRYHPDFPELKSIVLSPNICVARAALSDLRIGDVFYKDRSNPWNKYYRPKSGDVWIDTWYEAGLGGLDTSILPDPATYAKVSFNPYLNRYIMIAKRYVSGESGGFYLYQTQDTGTNADLTRWTHGILIDGLIEGGSVRIGYPSLVGPNTAGGDRLTDRDNMLYYARDEISDSPFVNGNHYMVRRGLSLIKDRTPPLDFNVDIWMDLLWWKVKPPGGSGSTVAHFLDGNGGFLEDYGIEAINRDPWVLIGTTEMSGDNRLDMVWYNRCTGVILLWLLRDPNGVTVNVNEDVAVIGTLTDCSNKIPISCNDFDGDGSVDLIFYNKQNGRVTGWKMSGLHRKDDVETDLFDDAQLALALKNDNWLPIGTMFFNNNVTLDLVWWRKSDGAFSIWENRDVNQTIPLEKLNPAEWRPVGFCDWNRDGVGDVIWRHQSILNKLIVNFYGQGGGVHTGNQPLGFPVDFDWIPAANSALDNLMWWIGAPVCP